MQNASAAFEQLNRCLDDVKEWMSTSSYSTTCSQSGNNFLVIPKFYPSIHISVKQFGNSLAFDAPTVWNALPDETCASSSLASFRNWLKTYLCTKEYLP